MVCHVGIYPEHGKIMVYDSFTYRSTSEQLALKIIDGCCGVPTTKVDEFYEEIKTKVNEKLGCACLTLNYGYGSEIRKQFIESGLKAGFVKVEIINELAAIYLNAISESRSYIPRNNNIIWIIIERCSYVWQILDLKGKYLGRDLSYEFDKDDIDRLMVECKLNKYPDVVLFKTEHKKKVLKMVENVVPYKKSTEFSDDYSVAALLRARLLAGDKEMLYLDIHTFACFYSESAKIYVDNCKKEEIERNAQLPLHRLIRLNDDEIHPYISVEDGKDLSIRTIYKNNKIKFELDINQISDVRKISPKILTITNENVIVYDVETKDKIFFSATADYGFKDVKIGVGYSSPSVIGDIIKQFDTLSCKTLNIIKEFRFDDHTKRFFAIKYGANERLISSERVIVDLFQEANNRAKIDGAFVMLIIPSHFNESQREKYIKAAAIAGLSDNETMYEYVALVYGIGRQILPDFYYMIIHFADPIILLAICKTDRKEKRICMGKRFDYEEIIIYENLFHEKIVESVKPNGFPKYFEHPRDQLTQFVCAIIELLFYSNDVGGGCCYTACVTRNHMLYKAIHENYSTHTSRGIFFIEDPEQLILEGAASSFEIL